MENELGISKQDEAINRFISRVQKREISVGVIGLGYVGLPLALTLVERNFRVVGFDIDERKIALLHKGECYIRHFDGMRVHRALASNLFSATNNFAKLKEVDAILVCVPTPLTEHRQPDMRAVVATMESVSANLQRQQLIVLESTTYPGTTEKLVRESLEKSGLRCGVDFFLAYSPEREDPGNKNFNTSTIPKIIGADDHCSRKMTEALYGEIVTRTVTVSNAKTAEATKLTENVFRSVNIALVNELKIIFDKMGIDIWEVLDAAETKPFGFMRFNPGPGWGGHCIPLDPFYLSWKAREFGIVTRFIELAGEINIAMTNYVIGKLLEALNHREKAVKNSNIMLIGIAYKSDIDDARESPAFALIDRLITLGANISYHDPHIHVAPKMRSWPGLPVMKSEPLNLDVIRKQDAVLIVTAHRAVDYELIKNAASLIVDTRGIFSAGTENVIRA